MDNEVFTIRKDEWQAKVNGVVLPTTWNSRGAALAGVATIMIRINKRRIKNLVDAGKGVLERYPNDNTRQMRRLRKAIEEANNPKVEVQK